MVMRMIEAGVCGGGAGLQLVVDSVAATAIARAHRTPHGFRPAPQVRLKADSQVRLKADSTSTIFRRSASMRTESPVVETIESTARTSPAPCCRSDDRGCRCSAD